MPLALAILGVLVLVTAVKGNYAAVGQEFNTTFFGSGSGSGFLVWFGSVLGIAILFRLIQAPKAGEMFIALLIIVYFLQHDNILSTIETSIQSAGATGTTTGSSK